MCKLTTNVQSLKNLLQYEFFYIFSQLKIFHFHSFYFLLIPVYVCMTEYEFCFFGKRYTKVEEIFFLDSLTVKIVHFTLTAEVVSPGMNFSGADQ